MDTVASSSSSSSFVWPKRSFTEISAQNNQELNSKIEQCFKLFISFSVYRLLEILPPDIPSLGRKFFHNAEGTSFIIPATEIGKNFPDLKPMMEAIKADGMVDEARKEDFCVGFHKEKKIYSTILREKEGQNNFAVVDLLNFVKRRVISSEQLNDFCDIVGGFFSANIEAVVDAGRQKFAEVAVAQSTKGMPSPVENDDQMKMFQFLIFAIEEGLNEEAKIILGTHPYASCLYNENTSPLMTAIKYDNHEMQETLLHYGAPEIIMDSSRGFIFDMQQELSLKSGPTLFSDEVFDFPFESDNFASTSSSSSSLWPFQSAPSSLLRPRSPESSSQNSAAKRLNRESSPNRESSSTNINDNQNTL